jgi:hypothetical protein
MRRRTRCPQPLTDRRTLPDGGQHLLRSALPIRDTLLKEYEEGSRPRVVELMTRTVHQAVACPGRCLSRVKFEAVSVDQGQGVALGRAPAEVVKRVTEPATVAELCALARLRVRSGAPAAAGA